MITAYLWGTPNGYKIAIALEEMGLDYQINWVNIGAGEQHDPEYLRVSPNGKIPAIVDHETGISLMESGAILQYLADKTGQFGGDSHRTDGLSRSGCTGRWVGSVRLWDRRTTFAG